MLETLHRLLHLAVDLLQGCSSGNALFHQTHAKGGDGIVLPALVDLAVETLAPIGAEMKRLVADPAYIDAVLADGAGRAEAIAAPTLDAVKDIVGFVRRGPALRTV